MKKLSPKIKFGCSKCQSLKLDLNIDTNIKLSEQQLKSKVTSINPEKNYSSSKVISLF